jgi:hypothetical protein
VTQSAAGVLNFNARQSSRRFAGSIIFSLAAMFKENGQPVFVGFIARFTQTGV